MYLETVFKRVIAGGVAWTTDVLPQSSSGVYIPPYASGGAIPAGYLGANDYTLSVRPRDDSGFPPLRIVVGYSGPGGAPSLVFNLYAFDRRTGLYYLTPDSPKTIAPGTLGYFGAVSTYAPAQTFSTQQGPGAISGSTDFVLLVTPSGTTNGTYTFAMGPGYGRSAP
jgi:hypothetical protein